MPGFQSLASTRQGGTRSNSSGHPDDLVNGRTYRVAIPNVEDLAADFSGDARGPVGLLLQPGLVDVGEGHDRTCLDHGFGDGDSPLL